jgi:hypothetical protein
MNFQQARKHHNAVAVAARDDEEYARDLWNAVVGMGPDDILPGSYAEAVRDTLPQEHAPLLASNDVAAAYAFTVHASYAGGKKAPILLRDEARANWTRFVTRAKETEELAQGFGWDLSAAWQASVEVAGVGADMGSVEKIARLAGRMYASIRGANASRVPATGGEIYSVEQGNNLGRLLASEQMLLMDPDLELPVLERIATRRAMQYAVRGTEKAARGPMVVLLDESSSMHARRNEWAKAAAIAMARVAKDESREFVAVHYSASVYVQKMDPGSPSDVIQMIKTFLRGGTAIAQALSVGLDQVAELAAKGARGGDVILVTDGVDYNLSEQHRQVSRAAAANVRLWTVAIECDISPDSPLRQGAASYIRLADADMGNADSAVGLAGAAR